MLKHYIVISWRNIVRNKFYTIVLILGLSVGISTAILLGMYSLHELSYDNFHDKKDQIFLVGVDSREEGDEYQTGWTTPPTGPALKEYFPEITSMTRLCFWFKDVMVSRGQQQYVEQGIVAADSTVFDVFTIPFIAGDPETALTEPNTIVISRSTARKYFKNEDALGQTLQFEHFFHECKVTGIVEDYPENSHFGFDMLLSLSSLKTINFDFDDSWENHTFSTYVLIKDNTSAKNLENQFPKFLRSTLDPYFSRKYHKTFAEWYAGNNYYKLFLTPLSDVHLSTLIFENREGKRMLTYALAFLAITITVLVCINYTNLASVLALSRRKEVGIRKTTGSKNNMVFKQFIIESTLIAFISLIISFGIIEVALPFFNSLTDQSLTLDYSNPLLIGGCVVFALVVGILSGFYPAYTLAHYNPVRALKGNSTGEQRSWLRNGLVIFQFTICLMMIVSTIVVYKQLNFMTNINVGFTKDQVMVIRRPGGLKENRLAFKNELQKNPDVLSVSYAATTPGRHFDGHGQHFEGNGSDVFSTIYPFRADEDILETLDLEIVQGIGFKERRSKNTMAILNEAAVKANLLENPLKEKIDHGTMGDQSIEIVGVVKDFHFQSFYHTIEPLVIYTMDINDYNAEYILVKVNGKNIPQTIASVERTWKQFSNNYLFEYSFLDQDFARLFERERTIAQVYTIFSAIAIFIACLGLLGLASYFTDKRTKEIGIRKISGASVSNIALLLSKDFGRLIFISIILGSTGSWYLMGRWLENFAYQTPVSWWIFALASVVIVVISAITISWHMITAANRNPVEALRYE
jgi:putative ABC transport system permease protein